MFGANFYGLLRGRLASFMAGLRGHLAILRDDLRVCLVATFNDYLELFKGLLGLFLDDFMAVFMAFYG